MLLFLCCVCVCVCVFNCICYNVSNNFFSCRPVIYFFTMPPAKNKRKASKLKDDGMWSVEGINDEMLRDVLKSTAEGGDGMFWSSKSHELSSTEKVEVLDAALTFMDTLTEDEIDELEGTHRSGDLSQMIASTFIGSGQIPIDSITKPIFDKIFKSPKAISLRAVQEYMEPYCCPYYPIVLLNMHEKFYPSQIPSGQFKLTACEAWLVKLIKPQTEECEMIEDQADEILTEMSKLPIRVQTISHLLKAVEFLKIKDFVMDEEKEKFKTTFQISDGDDDDDDDDDDDEDDD